MSANQTLAFSFLELPSDEGHTPCFIHWGIDM